MRQNFMRLEERVAYDGVGVIAPDAPAQESDAGVFDNASDNGLADSHESESGTTADSGNGTTGVGTDSGDSDDTADQAGQSAEANPSVDDMTVEERAANDAIRLILINNEVSQYEDLVENIQDGVDYFVYDNDNSLQAITDKLSAFLDGREYESIALVTEGDAGELMLAENEVVTDGTLLTDHEFDQQGFFLLLSEHIIEGGQIDLLGCNIAQGISGEALLDDIAALTGLTIAGSDDLTGRDTMGGDWTLEVLSTDSMQPVDLTTDFFNSSVLTQYNALLADNPFAGGSGTEADPWQIRTIHQLQAIDSNADYLDDCYVLLNDIDASATRSWNGGNGFDPIGSGDFLIFDGYIEGAYYSINNLYINRPNEDYIGLISYNQGEIYRLGLESSGSISTYDIVGRHYVGSIVGYNNRYISGVDGIIRHCYSENSIYATGGKAGGLVGENHWGVIEYSYATGSVTAVGNEVGGLVGYHDTHYTPPIKNCFATGAVRSISGDYAGGLVGNAQGPIENSSAYGDASGRDYIGGLVGWAFAADCTNCYARGDVSGNNFIGGLIGISFDDTSYCYASGDVKGNSNVGGLIGRFSHSYIPDLTKCFSTGSVYGNERTGALVGQLKGNIINCYANGTVYSNSEDYGEDYIGGLIGGRYDGNITGSEWNTALSLYKNDMNWSSSVWLASTLNSGELPLHRAYNNPPYADTPDFGIIEKNTSITITTSQLLGNSKDVESASLCIDRFMSGTDYDISDNNDGTWTITPEEGFLGNLVLSYYISDGQVSVLTSAKVKVIEYGIVFGDEEIAGAIDNPEASGNYSEVILDGDAVIVTRLSQYLVGIDRYIGSLKLCNYDGTNLTYDDANLTVDNEDITFFDGNNDGVYDFYIKSSGHDNDSFKDDLFMMPWIEAGIYRLTLSNSGVPQDIQITIRYDSTYPEIGCYDTPITSAYAQGYTNLDFHEAMEAVYNYGLLRPATYEKTVLLGDDYEDITARAYLDWYNNEISSMSWLASSDMVIQPPRFINPWAEFDDLFWDEWNNHIVYNELLIDNLQSYFQESGTPYSIFGTDNNTEELQGFHSEAAFAIRSNESQYPGNVSVAGLQAVYDIYGNLITTGFSAGSVDKIAPKPLSDLFVIGHWNVDADTFKMAEALDAINNGTILYGYTDGSNYQYEIIDDFKNLYYLVRPPIKGSSERIGSNPNQYWFLSENNANTQSQQILSSVNNTQYVGIVGFPYDMWKIHKPGGFDNGGAFKGQKSPNDAGRDKIMKDIIKGGAYPINTNLLSLNIPSGKGYYFVNEVEQFSSFNNNFDLPAIHASSRQRTTYQDDNLLMPEIPNVEEDIIEEHDNTEPNNDKYENIGDAKIAKTLNNIDQMFWQNQLNVGGDTAAVDLYLSTIFNQRPNLSLSMALSMRIEGDKLL